MARDNVLLLSIHESISLLSLVRDIGVASQDRYAQGWSLQERLNVRRWFLSYSQLFTKLVVFIWLQYPFFCLLPECLGTVARVWLFLNGCRNWVDRERATAEHVNRERGGIRFQICLHRLLALCTWATCCSGRIMFSWFLSRKHTLTAPLNKWWEWFSAHAVEFV